MNYYYRLCALSSQKTTYWGQFILSTFRCLQKSNSCFHACAAGTFTLGPISLALFCFFETRC